MKAKLDKLIVLFDALADQDASLEQIALKALSLLAVLSDDQEITNQIAADLALVFDSNYKGIDDLKNAFRQIDSELEDNLRGFSALLDHVLLENTVRLDSDYLLKQLPECYQLLAKPFHAFINRRDSYYDLSMQIDFNCEKVLTILFINLLMELYCVRFSLGKYDALCLLNEDLLLWLGDKNKFLIVDFDIADQPSVINYVKDKNIYAYQYVFAYLSIAHADGVLLEETLLARLDAVLQEAGFLRLKPLLDAQAF